MALARLQLAAEESKSELFEIVRRRSVRSGDFKLASGIRTNLYFDLKATIMNPQGGALIARAFLNEAYDLGVDFVGGLALGAVPTLGAMAAISQLEGRPVGTFFVRQKPKEHGTRALVEGLSPDESLNQRRALVVDDVATKGGSIMEAIIAARQAGAIVNSAMVIVDREKGAEERLREEGVRLFSLFRESDFA
ncbi:MAG: orotate phosphoribosyltransferase [Caulobacteraceae bacterium]